MSLFSLQFRFDDLLAAQEDADLPQHQQKQIPIANEEVEQTTPHDTPSSPLFLSSNSSSSTPSSPCKSPEPSVSPQRIQVSNDDDAIEQMSHELTNKYLATLLDITLKLPQSNDNSALDATNDTHVTKLTRSEPHYSYRKYISQSTTVPDENISGVSNNKLDTSFYHHRHHHFHFPHHTAASSRDETVSALNKSFAAVYEPIFKRNVELVEEALRIKQERAEAEARAKAQAKAEAEARIKAQAKAKAEAEARARAEAKARAEAEKQKREEAEARMKAKAAAEARAQAEKAQQSTQTETEAKTGGTPSGKSPYLTNFKTVEETFLSYKKKILSIKTEIVEPVKSLDREQRNLLSRHKRKLNPKFGQLTNSLQQLRLIVTETIELIQETKPNELYFKWILNFVAKAIVHQAETEVRVKPEAALPLARLAVLLMQTFPELEDFLMARLVKKCPYVIGFTCPIDTETGRTNMGWKRAADNKWEDDASYNERIGGMATLFATITRLGVSPVDQGTLGITEATNPWFIDRSWRMVARISNTPRELLTDTHFVVLGAWWDAAAAQFVQVYQNQAVKLLQVVGDSLVGLVLDKKFVGAVRLKILYEEFMTSNTIKSFPEMDP